MFYRINVQMYLDKVYAVWQCESVISFIALELEHLVKITWKFQLAQLNILQ